MSAPVLWWIVAGSLLTLEMLTGTFYLLMLALGAGVGAIAAHLGVDLVPQLVLAALVGGSSVALWHRRRLRAGTTPAEASKDVNLDIGEEVQVGHWAAHGHTKVQYRGATWQARLAAGQPACTGPHRIVEVLGNQLVLAPLDRTPI